MRSFGNYKEGVSMMKDRQQSIIRPEQEIGGKNPRDFVQALQKILRFHSMLSAT